MDGKVTDFLIDYDFLTTKILKSSKFEKSIYKTDPGLFFLSSSSMLTHIDKSKNLAYFTILTPNILEQDLSPLYKVTNFGWYHGESIIKNDLPEYVYFLSDGNRVKIVEPDLKKCSYRKGTYLCQLRDSLLSREASCLEYLISPNEDNPCKIKVSAAHKSCAYKSTLGGVVVHGCDDVSTITSYRGISAHKN